MAVDGTMSGPHYEPGFEGKGAKKAGAAKKAKTPVRKPEKKSASRAAR
jgi:hypothetical protein